MKRLPLLLIFLPLLFACSGEPDEGPQRPAQRPLPAVEVAEVLHHEIGQQLKRTATLRAWSEVRLSTEEEGRIERLPHYPGDRVSQGDELLRLDQALLAAQLSKARAVREQAELDLRRLDRLQASRVVAEDELARARTAVQVAIAEEDLLRTRLSNTRIRSPFDGVIIARLAEPGDSVGRFNHVLTLADISRLLVELRLSELALPGLAVGDKVTLRLDSLADESFVAKVLRIHPTVDPTTRQGVVELLIEQPPAQARPGQLVRVELGLRPLPRTTIPFVALRRDTQGEYVFTVDEQMVLQRTPVRSGIQLGERVEISSGLEAGQQVVKGGFLGLAEGMTVRLPAREGAQ